ncbi:MAG: tetratricopeptide repeat protein [Pseudomonadota bacterium]
MRAAHLIALVFVWAGGLAAAQTTPTTPPATTLEDIRLNLAAIDAQVDALRAQLSDTGQTPPELQGPALSRLDLLERQMRLLTGRVEQIQNDIRRMADDAGRRYADVEFRLSEIEGGDTALLGDPVPLGGGLTNTPPPGPGPAAVEVAVSERNSFDQAMAVVETDPALAESRFAGFLASYPDSPLAAEALLGQARAQRGQERIRDAAKSYLDAFSADPTGPFAAPALLGVGASLRQLGQLAEACLTYDEVAARFPAAGAEITAELEAERAEAGCR